MKKKKKVKFCRILQVFYNVLENKQSGYFLQIYGLIFFLNFPL